MDSGHLIGRLLQPADLGQFQGLIRQQEKLFGADVANHWSRVLESAEHYINGERQCSMGVFDDDRLVFSASIYLWLHFPYWACNNVIMHSAIKRRGTACTKELLKCGIYACRDYAESIGLYDYFACIPVRRYRAYQKLYESWDDPIYTRYAYFTEGVVPAGTRPKYDYQWNLMGKKEWVIDIAFRRISLKEEHRPYQQALSRNESHG